MLICAARQLIAILDVVQEHGQLSNAEILLRRDLKSRLLGLTAVEKLRLKQKSRLTYIKASEANSKLFYLHANGRRKKNSIRSLHTGSRIMYTHEEKAECVYQHFNNKLGQFQSRGVTLDWETLQLQRRQLQHLDQPFSEDEVRAVVDDIEADKAPGPDGFIGAFYKASWSVIKHDVLAAVNYFYSNHDQHYNLLNIAHIVLLPKKGGGKHSGGLQTNQFIT